MLPACGRSSAGPAGASGPGRPALLADVRADVSFGPINLGLDDAEVRVRVAEALELLDVTEPPTVRSTSSPTGSASVWPLPARWRCGRRSSCSTSPRPGWILGRSRPCARRCRIRARGTTVVVSTHDIDFAWEWADEVGVVVDGIVHQGSTVKIMTDEALLGRAHLGVPGPCGCCVRSATRSTSSPRLGRSATWRASWLRPCSGRLSRRSAASRPGRCS